MNSRIIIGFSVCLVLATYLIFFIRLSQANQLSITFEDGIGIVTEEDLENVIRLNGKWEFYANEILTPSEIKNITTPLALIDVPKGWGNYVDSTKEVEVGTYRILLKVPEDRAYGFRFNSIRHGNKVYINGIEAGGEGNPNPTEYSFMEKKFNVFGESDNGEIEVVVQVAHHFKSNGGIVKPVLFGTEEKITNYTDRVIIIDSLAVFGIFIIGIIFLLNSITQRSFSSDFLFSLYCLAQSLYAATQNEKVLLIFFPEMDNYSLWSWQFTTIHLTIILLVCFSYSIFKEHMNKKVMAVVIALLCTTGLIYGINNKYLDLFQFNLPPIILQGTVLISLMSGMFLSFITILKGVFHDRERAIHLLLAIIAFFCYLFSLGLELLFEVHMGYWPILMQIVMIISMAYFISYREKLKNQKVRELTQELLVEQELRDEQLSKIAQSVDQPLLNLIQSTNNLMDGKTGPLIEAQQEVVNIINLEVKKIKRMITDFMHASKLKGQVHLTIQPTIINMLNELIYEISFFINDSKKVKVISDFSSNLPIVYADVKRLKQALFNILHNAVKYTETGEIIVTAYKEDQFLYITIEDTGIGIEPNELSKVFDPYYRVPNVSQNENEALGIGVGTAQHFLKMMKGDISIESQVGKGTIVTIRLPAAETNIKEFELDQVQRNCSVDFPLHIDGDRKERIVIIDRNKCDLLDIVKILEKNHFTVDAFVDGEAVLKFIENHRIDLIIIDLYMPKEYILHVTEVVRSHYNKTELPIMLLSKTEQLEAVKSLFEKGINVIKRRPLIEEEFISQINSLISMKSAVEDSVKKELRSYHAQITPHFLFNTLNTIIGLSFVDIEKAREALEHLAIYFRAKLDYQKIQSVVSIEEELELVGAYLAIEKLRFNHLNIELNIDTEIEIDIPAMTLQPLVENAIQHGLKNRKEGATLFISVQEVGEYVEIIIEDNGIGMSEEKQKQLLRSESERLGFLNPFYKITLMKDSKFELHSEEGKGTRIVIMLLNRKLDKEVMRV